MFKQIMMVGVLAAAACGGDDGGGGAGGGPVTVSQARDVCEGVCMRDEECMTLDPEETVASCTDECTLGLSGGGYRADVIIPAGECVAALQCGADDDQCLVQECTPTSAHEAYEAACRTKVAECGGSGSAVDNACETTLMDGASGDVGFFCIFTADVMDALRACFEMPCADIEACFEQVQTQFMLDL